MTQAEERRMRALVRRANRQRRLRTEIRKLDEEGLLKRLGRYVGLTKSELKYEYRRIYQRGLDRERVIRDIVAAEVGP